MCPCILTMSNDPSIQCICISFTPIITQVLLIFSLVFVYYYAETLLKNTQYWFGEEVHREQEAKIIIVLLN